MHEGRKYWLSIVSRFKKSSLYKYGSKKLDKLSTEQKRLLVTISEAVGISIVIFGIAITSYILILNNSYKLSPSLQKVVGKADGNLFSKISYEGKDNSYYLAKNDIGKNPNGVKSEGDSVSSPSGYSAILPKDISKGITTYDNSLNLSITIKPEISTYSGRMKDGQMVYPVGVNGAKLVYSLMHNGVEENIAFNKPTADKLEYKYKLILPSGLEARKTTSGDIGIYSADPVLYGNISYGSDSDKQKLMLAKKHAKKDNLVFVIPAPVINSANGKTGSAKASVDIHNDEISILATGLRSIKSSFSIDPSIVVASISSFQNGGNNEEDIYYDTTNNQIYQGGIGGGETGAWTVNSGSNNYPGLQGTIIFYNNVFYSIGGSDGTNYINRIIYAKLDSSNNLGAWTTSNVTFPNITSGVSGAVNLAGVAYNGYLYAGAGANSAASSTNVVFYAAVCTGQNTTTAFSTNCNNSSNAGDISSWNSTISLPTALQKPNWNAYNGYLYSLQGFSTNTYYAKINADGTLASWSLGSTMAVNGSSGVSFIYNNYIYYIGGNSGGSNISTAYYATINSSTGAIGSWKTTTSLPQPRRYSSFALVGGYIYYICGSDGTSNQTTVYYAPIYTDGSIGMWLTSSNSLPVSNTVISTSNLSVNNRLFFLSSNSKMYSTTVNATGGLTSWNSTNGPGSLRNFETSTWNGYIYVLGGIDNNGNYSNNVYYAAICTGLNTTTAFTNNCSTSSSSGSLSSWNTTTSLTQASAFGASITINSYIYVIGGDSASNTHTNSVYVSTINLDGTLAGWISTTVYPTNISGESVVAANGSFYVIGGNNGSANRTNVYYPSQIFAGGTLGTWKSATSIPTATQQMAISTYGGYIYILGGSTGSNTANTYMAAVCTGNNTTTVFSSNCTNSSANGTTSSWKSITSLPSASSLGNSFVNNSYIYYLGGYSNSVYSAMINNDGSIGTWNTTTSITNPNSSSGLGAMGSVSYAGYAYYIAGWDQTNFNTNSYYSYVLNGGSGLANGWNASSTKIPSSFSGSTSAVYNGYIYYIRSPVYYAQINSDGSIGAWTTTTTLPFNNFGSSAFAYNGYLYDVGGYSTSASALCAQNSACNTVLRAPINSNGSLGSWTNLSSTPLPSSVENFGMVQWNGYLYALGGTNGVTAINGVYYTKINSDGSLAGWNTSAYTLPLTTSSMNTIGYGGYIYLLGGSGGSQGKQVLYSKINSDGSIGAWTNTTPLNGSSGQAQAFAYNGYLYVLGGGFNASYQPNSYSYAPINANGSVGAWTTVGPNNFLISNYSFEGNGCSTNGWTSKNSATISAISTSYFLGGCSAQVTAASSNVSSTSTSGMYYPVALAPNTTYNMAAYVYALTIANSSDIVLGWSNNGVDNNCPLANPPVTLVVSSWKGLMCTFTTGATVSNTGLYISSTVASDSINVDNVVALASASTPSSYVPDNISSGSAVTYKGYAYLISGASSYNSENLGYYGNDITYYTSLQSLPRIGSYSQLQDLSGNGNQDPTPFEMSINGGACVSGSACGTNGTNSLPTSGSGGLNGPGGLSVSYAFARNICTTFNTSANLTYIYSLFGKINSTPNNSTACSSPNNAIGNSRYVWTRMTLDDSLTATFPDSLSNKTTISNYNWYFHAANNARLRGGASFSNGSLNTLDAPPN